MYTGTSPPPFLETNHSMGKNMAGANEFALCWL